MPYPALLFLTPFTAPWEPPCDFTRREAESVAMLRHAELNTSLLEYLYPKLQGGSQAHSSSVQHSWRVATAGCKVEAAGCWCFHVPGSMVKHLNPRGFERCVPKWRVENCSSHPKFRRLAAQDCSCLTPREPGFRCLFGDMRPAKLLAIIAAARAEGVTHIVEQGRYGGLSAYMYALHGFKVTSIELVPLEEVSSALRASAPSITLVDGDGRTEVLNAVARAPSGERLAVIFDGEKRLTAYETFKQVRKRVALAVFDDSNLDAGNFPRVLQQRGERAWHTWECAFSRRFSDARQLRGFEATLLEAAARLASSRGVSSAALVDAGLVDDRRRLIFHGGMEDLSRFHLTIVWGGAAGPDDLGMHGRKQARRDQGIHGRRK